MLLPTTGKFWVMGMLALIWMAWCRQAMRLNANQPYHLAAYHRDRRKARFYFLSVWVGLVAAFLSFLSLEAMAGVTFDSVTQRDWIFSILRGLGLWGLMMVAMVWSQVGLRASQPNSDGASLLPAPEPRKDKK